MKKRIAHCFNKAAETYDSAAIVQRTIAKQLAKRLENITAESILEIGCGTGLFSDHLIAQFPQASFYLTDIAPAMVKTCQQRFHQKPKIKVDCVDGEAVTLPRQFDLITSNMTLQWFTQLETSLANLIHKLTPGGQLAFAMLGENSLQEWRDICEQSACTTPTPRFVSYASLEKNLSHLDFEQETIQHTYSSLYDFLNSLKKLGATAARHDYSALPSGKLRQLIKKHNHTITISYEVIYGRYRRI